MNATADNDYAICPRCKWAGKLRKDGTMRKHRESVDMGRSTMSGGLPQQRHGEICEGSGEKPWDHTPPDGGYVVKTSDHGGTRLVDTNEEPKQASGPSLDDYAQASRIIQSLIPRGRR